MVLTILIAFFSLIMLMVVHEFGHFILAKKFGVKVEEFGLGYPPRLFGKKIGQTLYSINLIPLGAFVKIHGEQGGIENSQSFVGKPIWQRILIVFGGVAAFWIAALVIFSIVFSIGASIPVSDEADGDLADPRVQVWTVTAGSPAQIAGIKPGDVIRQLKINNQQLAINKTKEVVEFTNAHLDEEVILTIEREKEVFDVFLTPRASPPPGQGPMGVTLERMTTIIKKNSWYQAPIQGTVYCGDLTLKSIKSLVKIVGDILWGRGVPPGAEMAGPLGITVWLAKVSKFGAGFYLYFIGVITVYLAMFNLLPIPALDGGKLLFLVIEKVSEKPIPPKIEQTITMIFFVLLITLAIFVTIKFDIPSFFEFIKSGL